VEQNRYQIRFEWAATGARVLAETGDVDVYVWVDAIPTAGEVVASELPPVGAVVSGSLDSAAADAAWIVRLQKKLARRVVVAIIAAGDQRADGSPRFAIEDLLAAGAIIDQLNKLGLDATSPEAAVAEAAFLQLKPAVGHLVSASVTSKGLASAVGASEGSGISSAFSARVNADLSADDVVVIRAHESSVPE
jgi:2-phosphosulfolactate phosphatase